MSNYLPLLDELCCRSAAFIKSCLESDSPTVSAVAHYGVYYGRMNSHIGRNAFFCCSRYDVADILCVTRCMVSHYVDEYISPQLRASVLLLLELLFIRVVALVVPCCHRMKLMNLLILFAHFDANKLL